MRNSFGIGDVVTYGKSNTEWEITEETEPSVYTLKSEKGSTKRNVSWDKLTLVRDAAPVCADVTEEWAFTDAQIEELDETYADHGMPAAQEAKAEMLSGLDPADVLKSSPEDQKEHLLTDYPYAGWEIALLAPGAKYALHVGYDVQGFKSYGAACDALIRERRENSDVPMAIDHNGRRLVTRMAV